LPGVKGENVIETENTEGQTHEVWSRWGLEMLELLTVVTQWSLIVRATSV
jgi:hypothetical protein